MIFWKRFYTVRETKRLMSTLPITKTPVSYLYFQIERIDFYRLQYTRTEIWKLRMQKNSQQTVRIPFYTDAMHLFENEDICFFSWCDNGITPTKPGLYILG